MKNILEKINQSLDRFLDLQAFSARQQEIFFRSLSFLVSANISLADSLEILMKQNKAPRKRKIISHLQVSVDQGESLSFACVHFAYIFNSVIRAHIKSGEISGRLAERLASLADDQKRFREAKGKLVGMLVYPAIILLAGLILVSILLVFVFPKLISVFQGSSVPLPLITRLVIALSDGLGR
ncbi:MAG: type II secretion system F family protein, partial [Candidatus Pacebacteria bacterium]|nr:type II secretion system F family protein [Candidatus Paceibacterota bacterium]